MSSNLIAGSIGTEPLAVASEQASGPEAREPPTQDVGAPIKRDNGQ